MRYYGEIGYAEQVETAPGVIEEIITKRNYYGESTKLMSRWQTGSGLNDNLEITNNISIIADPYAYQNFYNMRYIEYAGAKWKIISVEVQRPRLILIVGGLYNGEED